VWFLDSNCTDSGTSGGDGKWVSLGPMGIIGMARDTQTDALTHSREDGQRCTLLLNTSCRAMSCSHVICSSMVLYCILCYFDPSAVPLRRPCVCSEYVRCTVITHLTLFYYLLLSSPHLSSPHLTSLLLSSPLLSSYCSNRSITGRISSAPSSSTSSLSPCGICIDWLENDTLVVAASIPVRARPSHDPTVRTSKAKYVPPPLQSASGSGSKRVYDFAFTALTVGDIFTGGYSTPTSEPGPRTQKGTGLGMGWLGGGKNLNFPVTDRERESERERERERESRGCSPGVGVLREVTSDLTGLRSIPATTSSTTSSPTSSPAARKDAVSIVVCAGSLMIALSFPAVRAGHGTADTRFQHRPLTVTELQAVYMDVRTRRTYF
jgi:hypothetical protein